ncbi:aminotransferase class IV [Legionella pneumophila]|uniref:Aminodeoxychorismate lyase n=1 Tax=Legionella pneumophila subsp. pascullei TaxID=91890 RepID=A0AAX2IU37_LEGPN|nr:aminotransferase class IV [Legionella pneumophila]AMP90678.2 4-amino-4-deoxychorismate lyase [Legionella pneumophila subsp. pascullei]SQG89428.1 4-amino-4-deoxychorismate lyase [Legionella pneumophila subsp. pascullei]VEH04691.1 4-amino-4-deoxychorismate lyase [Legionella pneumophila subsp. pascullei]HAT6918220.1 4-amino-4-deoxychorismate lyase [Legionella pneumophila]HAT6921274.1 4-amino-4-deoxychorismate lyase [Legionella pneumophila]
MPTRVIEEKGDVTPSFGIDDRIFLGEGLFETIRVNSSKPSYAYRHWERLGNSARQLGIPFEISFDDWFEHLIQKIQKDNLYHGGIKAILSGGPASRGLAERGQVSQLIFQTFNYSIQKHPVRLISVNWLRDKANPLYRLKSVNYLEAIIAQRQAVAVGADDALFFNTESHVTETTCANLFLIENNVLYTPQIEDGVLPGITRSLLISLCQQHNIPVQEISLTKKRVEEADAVILTNSLQGIRRVLSLDSIVFEVNHPIIDKLVFLLNQDESW